MEEINRNLNSRKREINFYSDERKDELLLGKLEVKSKQTQVQKLKLITGVEIDLKVWDIHKAGSIKDIKGHQSRILSLTHSQSESNEKFVIFQEIFS